MGTHALFLVTYAFILVFQNMSVFFGVENELLNYSRSKKFFKNYFSSAFFVAEFFVIGRRFFFSWVIKWSFERIFSDKIIQEATRRVLIPRLLLCRMRDRDFLACPKKERKFFPIYRETYTQNENKKMVMNGIHELVEKTPSFPVKKSRSKIHVMEIEIFH